MRSVLHPTSPRWPFWLLIVAWGCANTPQAATYALLTWMAEARAFTHQHRLTADVAALLSGEAAPTTLASVNDVTPAKPVPLVPPDAVLKKIPLAIEADAHVGPPALRMSRAEYVSRTESGARRAQPPHGPPRTGTRLV